MKPMTLAALALLAVTSANADFSYTTTQKMTGGSMAQLAAGAANRTSKYFFKGQKLKVDTGETATILDFDAQTITTINNTLKTVSVKRFNDAAGTAPAVNAKIDVKETGQKKTVNGFNSSELLMNMEMEMATGRGGAPMKMQLEMDMWISPDPAGTSELRAFYSKNAARFPYSVMAGGGANASMQSAIAEMQKHMAQMNGVQVQQIIRLKPIGGMPGMPGMQMSGAQSAQLAQARAKLEEMVKAGGPGAAIAQQQLARMPGGAPSAGASDVMLEMTMDSSDFSTATIADSVFQLPADYKKAN